MKVIALDNNGEIMFQFSTNDDDADISPPELVKQNVIDVLIESLKALGVEFHE